MRKILLAIGLVFFGQALNAQTASLQERVDVYRVEQGASASGQQEERLLPVRDPQAGDELEYVLTYENRGAQPLVEFLVKSAIPPGAGYLGNSTNSSLEAELEFSSDGGISWSAPPLVQRITGDGGIERAALRPPSDMTHIRWRTTRALMPGEQAVFRFRVRLE